MQVGAHGARDVRVRIGRGSPCAVTSRFRFSIMQIPGEPTVARTDHRRAVAEFVAAARAVDIARWERKPDGDRWSPAQIAEHVRLTYEVVGAQFSGGPGLRVRMPWWKRLPLRWAFLGRILESGVFPKGAWAPREIRPGDGPFDRETVLAALERTAAATEDILVARWTDGSRIMTHHVFGALDSPMGARLATVHTLHHAKQLRAFDSGPTASP